MSQIFELFGFPLRDRSSGVEASRKAKTCPFMGATCDGGGNRNQTKINLDQSPELRAYFNPGVRDVLPGLCSIATANATWVVCPRRLLAFRNDQGGMPAENACLQSHERSLLLACGIEQTVQIGIWSEVYLKFGSEESEINYHFDYVAAPLQKKTVNELIEEYGLSNIELHGLLKDLKRVGQVRGRIDQNAEFVVPDLTNPVIIEVMTASTSGSDSVAGTDIRNAFKNATLGQLHEAPGINKRQVWGRMVTQLFAKTALASNWGGKTVWVIQDELLKNIELTTRLKVRRIPKSDECPINLAVLQYVPDADGLITGQLSVAQEISGESGINLNRSDTFTDILLPSHLPRKAELLRAMARRKLAGIVRL